jgi:hypothetical protein
MLEEFLLSVGKDTLSRDCRCSRFLHVLSVELHYGRNFGRADIGGGILYTIWYIYSTAIGLTPGGSRTAHI